MTKQSTIDPVYTYARAQQDEFPKEMKTSLFERHRLNVPWHTVTGIYAIRGAELALDLERLSGRFRRRIYILLTASDEARDASFEEYYRKFAAVHDTVFIARLSSDEWLNDACRRSEVETLAEQIAQKM